MKIKIKTKKKSIISLCICISVLLSNSLICSAAYLSPHGYATEDFNSNNEGGYFYNQSGQVALHSWWSTTNNLAFVTDEMWVPFASGSQWIEIGDVDGSVNGNYWAGHYMAVKSSTGYTEYTIGANYSSSGHSFEVQLTTPNTWVGYVDFNKVMTFTMPFTSSFSTRCGIESNVSDGTFTSGIQDSALQYKDTSGVWHNWPSAIKTDANNLGFTSAYTANTNRITFTHK